MTRSPLACLCILLALNAPADEANTTRPDGLAIGYVCHFPMVTHEAESLVTTGANVTMVRAPWPFIEPEQGQFDFSLLDKQLEWADRNGLRLVYIMESGPAHATHVKWLMDKLRAQGQTMLSVAGGPSSDPSIFSTTYRRYLGRYLRRTVAYLANHRLSHCVYGYSNGCEWWYPMPVSYSPLAAAAFQQSLQTRYGTMAALNARWGTAFDAWGQVEPPKLRMYASGLLPQGYLIPEGNALDACYCTGGETHLRVEPGQELKLSAEYEATQVRAGGVSAEIAWLKATDPQPMKISRHEVPLPAGDSAGVVTLDALAPEGAARAWLLIKSHACGRATFRRITCTDASGADLAPNPELDPALGAWQFIHWSGGGQDAVSHGWDKPGEAWIDYTASLELPSGAKYPLAQVYDWLTFRACAVGDLIQWMAARIDEADPSRPVVTYLTFGFANAFEWDYAQQMGIYLDQIARIGQSVRVLGAQLASAEGDYDSVTCAFDMLRHHGKPMWAIDLLDFTRGVALGREGLTRLSLSVLQHGGTGMQYYCWHGTEHYNYSELGIGQLRKMVEATKRQARRMAGAKVAPDVALVMPRMPLYGALHEPANDWRDFMGWYKLLVRAGVCPDVYTLEELPAADLSGYRAVIVPDCAYILREALDALRYAATRCVALVTSGRFALLDMGQRPIVPALRPRAQIALGRPVGALLLGETYRCATPTDTPSRLVCREGSPQWDSDAAQEAMAAIARAGVPTLLWPGRAPLTAARFTRGAWSYAFVLPDASGERILALDAQSYRVPNEGRWVRLAQD